MNMNGCSQHVDKAVSTEDLCVVSRDINLEVTRLEAMLNTLVENKVESMKTGKPKITSNNYQQSPLKEDDKRFHWITSSSTASSSHKGNGSSHKLTSRHQRRSKSHHEKKRHLRRSDHGRYRISSNSPDPESPQYTQAIQPCCDHAARCLLIEDEYNKAFDFVKFPEYNVYTCDFDSTVCSCPDNHNGQINIQYEDYVSINIDNFETVEEDAIIAEETLRNAKRKRRRRKKRRRKKLQQRQLELTQATTEKVKVIDPDDLPQRARWTIVATACLLLLMCLLLVGVTLRMAPIIDDMVRRENEELINSLHNSSHVIKTIPHL